MHVFLYLLLYKLFFTYASLIGSTARICIVGDETEEDLNKPVFRDTGDIVSVSFISRE